MYVVQMQMPECHPPLMCAHADAWVPSPSHVARLFHCIETLDKKATPFDTKIFHSNGPNYDPSNTSVLVDEPFCTDRFDTVPALSMYSFYNVYRY